MNTDLKARAEALLAALKVDGFRYIAGRPLDDLPWLKEALAAFMEAADAATVLALIRERDESRAALKIEGEAHNLTLAERDKAWTALSAAREEVERYKIALADATRRPMGVLPASAVGLLTAAELDAAEARRPKHAVLSPAVEAESKVEPRF